MHRPLMILKCQHQFSCMVARSTLPETQICAHLQLLISGYTSLGIKDIVHPLIGPRPQEVATRHHNTLEVRLCAQQPFNTLFRAFGANLMFFFSTANVRTTDQPHCLLGMASTLPERCSITIVAGLGPRASAR